MAAGDAQDGQQDHQEQKDERQEKDPATAPGGQPAESLPYRIEEKQYLVQNRFQGIHALTLSVYEASRKNIGKNVK
jgi:hypothetical protein